MNTEIYLKTIGFNGDFKTILSTYGQVSCMFLKLCPDNSGEYVERRRFRLSAPLRSANDRQRFKLFALPSLLHDSAGNNVANSWQHNQVWVSRADYAVDLKRLNSIKQTTA